MGQVLPRLRHDHAGSPTAIQRSKESQRAQAQPHGLNRKTVAQVAAADHRCRTRPWARRNRVHRADGRGRGDRRGLPPPHAAAARRLPLRPAGDDPASDALVTSPAVPAARHLSPASHRRPRSPPRRGSRPTRSATSTSTSPRCRLRRAGSICSWPSTGRPSSPSSSCTAGVTRRTAADFLRAAHRGRPVQGPHRAHRQRHPLHDTPAMSGRQRISGRCARRRALARHSFELACADRDIDHRLTKPLHPWTNGQVERMNRTIKDATVRRYHYDDHDQLERHLADFVAAYNFGRRLKTLGGLTPFEAICKRWAAEPERFRSNPLHQMPGLNI